MTSECILVHLETALWARRVLATQIEVWVPQASIDSLSPRGHSHHGHCHRGTGALVEV